MKRFFALFLSLITIISMLSAAIPTAAADAYFTDITSTDTFDYIIEKIRSEENDYIAERIKLMIYGNEEYNPYGVGEKWFNASSYLTIYDGELQEDVNLRSSQCYGYANYVYHKLFGITCYDNGNTKVASISRGDMSVSALKAAIQKARCGSHVRGGNSHSLVFLTTDKDNNGFYYLDAYDYNGPYMVHLTYSTYSQFISKYGSLTFIYSPETYPSYSLPSILTVSDFSYPVTQKSGSGFSPAGKVMSNCDITKITASVKNANGTVIFSRTASPSSKYWDIAWFDNALTFSKLTTSGKYSYNLTASDSSGATVTISKDFTVGSSNTTSSSTTVEAVNATPSVSENKNLATLNDKTVTFTRSGDSFTDSGVINGKNVIVKATASVTVSDVKYYQMTDGSWVKGTDVSPLKSLTVSKAPVKTAYMDYETISVNGLKLTVTCENGSTFSITSGYDYFYDTQATGAVAVTVTYCELNTSFTISVTETNVVVGEKYEVLTNLRIRAHAGLTHEQVGTIPQGTVVTVTNKSVSDGYTWGQISYNGYTGWCALEYAKYISGTIVNSLTVTSDTVTVENGETFRINAVAAPSYAADTSLKFTASNESIVKVDSTGLITAVYPGSATVTVTTANGISQIVSVFVNGIIDYTSYLNAVFDSNSHLVSGIPIAITVSDLFEKYGATVYDENGNTISGDTLVSTGMTVKYNSNIYNAVVLGDINSDGRITSTDFIICRKSFLGLYPLDETKELAADVDGDGRITSTDFLQMRRHYLQLYNIYQ